MLLLPLSVDVGYTVANLIITDSFPIHTQALAGAVFNTMAQFGMSIGIAVMAVVSSSISQTHESSGSNNGEVLMKGYRAVFWVCFGLMVLTVPVGVWGLRGAKETGRRKG